MKEAFLSRLLSHGSFVVTTHLRPDGDAMGSQLALASFLKKLGKEVSVINVDASASNLDWMPGADGIRLFDGSLRLLELTTGADAIVIVDTNAVSRLGALGKTVDNSPAEKLLIDHHPAPEAWFTDTYVRESASSAGELVYELIAAHNPDLIDTDMATNLYTAIMTDTGSFRYSHVTADVHRVVADLLDRGKLDVDAIHAALFDTRTLSSLRFLGFALESIVLRYGGQLGYMAITQRMMREAGADYGDTEGFVNYMLSIEGVKVAVFFYESPKGVKISFRSRGAAFVHEWARAWSGGGHKHAAGAFFNGPFSVVVEEVIASAARYINFESDTSDEATALSMEDEDYLATLMEIKSRK